MPSPSLRMNLKKTLFFLGDVLTCKNVNVIVHRRQFCEVHQTGHSPRQPWLAGNSAASRTESIPASKRTCAFRKTSSNPRFKSFRPMKPGTPSPPLPCPSRLSLCNRATFPFKTLHSVKLPIHCRAPRPAWAAASFALHPDLHKKRTHGPSAGGG